MIGTVAGRRLAVIAVAGIVMNWLVYIPSENEQFEVASTWRDVSARDSATQIGLGSLNGLLDIQESSVQQGLDQAEDGAFTLAERRFTFDGVTYRLSGLVTGRRGGVTLTGSDGQPVRVTTGETLPTGERIISIGINAIEIETQSGEMEAVEIY